MNKVEERFKDKGIMQSGGWFILPKKDAMALVEECEKESIGILGIDGFFVHEDGRLEPSLENTADFSYFPSQIPFLESKNPEVVNAKNVYEASRAFLKEKDDKMYFEIVCDD